MRVRPYNFPSVSGSWQGQVLILPCSINYGAEALMRPVEKACKEAIAIGKMTILVRIIYAYRIYDIYTVYIYLICCDPNSAMETPMQILKSKMTQSQARFSFITLSSTGP